MNRLFFVSSEIARPSSYQRGEIIALHLRTKFQVDSHHVRVLPKDLEKTDVCIFIKRINDSAYKIAKSIGCKLIYDPIDNWINAIPFFDIVIACNEEHATWIKNKCDCQITIIDHLHTNIDRIKTSSSKIKHVGYLGVHTEFSMRSEMKQICDDLNLDWIFRDPYKENWKYSPVSLTQQALTLDLGVIYVDETLWDFKERTMFKPSGKLTLLMSHGIPVIFSPHISYQNVIGDVSELQYLVARSKDDVRQKIKELTENPAMYQNLSKVSFDVCEKYHLDRAFDEYYVKFVKS